MAFGPRPLPGAAPVPLSPSAGIPPPLRMVLERMGVPVDVVAATVQKMASEQSLQKILDFADALPQIVARLERIERNQVLPPFACTDTADSAADEFGAAASGNGAGVGHGGNPDADDIVDNGRQGIVRAN